MKYSAQNLARALIEMIEEEPHNYQEVVKGFVVFCKQMHLTYLFSSIFRYLEIESKREKNTKTLKIFSATELNEERINKIKKLIRAESSSQVEIIEDEGVVAGFIAHYRNKIIDASLSNNLHLLKNKIINN